MKAKRSILRTENREAGENPARARHCKRGALRKNHRGKMSWEGVAMLRAVSQETCRIMRG